MISCPKSGNQRLPGIEFHLDSIFQFHRHPSPGARLGSAAASEAKETARRPPLVGTAWPVSHELLAADPPGTGAGGLRIRLEESFPRSATPRAPGAPERGTRLPGCIAWGFPESVAHGKSDCRAIATSGCGTGVREAASHCPVRLAV